MLLPTTCLTQKYQNLRSLALQSPHVCYLWWCRIFFRFQLRLNFLWWLFKYIFNDFGFQNLESSNASTAASNLISFDGQLKEPAYSTHASDEYHSITLARMNQKLLFPTPRVVDFAIHLCFRVTKWLSDFTFLILKLHYYLGILCAY